MTKKLLMLLLVVGCVSTYVFAQDGEDGEMTMPPPKFSMDQPKAGSLLEVIPSDCMGYIAATNVKDLVVSIERLTRQLGFGKELDTNAPGGLLQTAAMVLQIGEGYNPNGGIAVVIPNMEKLGYDPAALGRGEEPASPEMPFVILVAGKSDTGIFPQAQKLETGGISIPGFPFPTIYTAQMGDYVAFSPSQKALDLMKGAALDTTLAKTEKDILGQNDVAVFYNLKVLGPFFATMADSASSEEDTPLFGEFAGILKLYGSFLKQMDVLAFGIKLGEKGISCNFYESVKSESELAKVLSAYQPSLKPLMNRLPSLPYVLAFGASMAGGEGSKAMSDTQMQFVEMLLNAIDLDIPKDLMEKITKTSAELDAMTTSGQFVAGPANGEGLFGISMVLGVTNAEKAKELLPVQIDQINQLVKAISQQKQNEDLESLKFNYIKNVETINSNMVDVIEVTFDKLKTQTDEQKAEMKKVLGEDKIFIRIAQTDPQTLVITFGGGKTFMGAAIDAARKGGTIHQDPNVQSTLKMLPSNPVSTLVLSPQNLFSLIQTGMVVMGEKSNLPEGFAFKCAEPIGIGWALAGKNAVKGSIYIPIGVVTDITEWVKAEAEAAAAAFAPPAESEEDVEVEVIEEK